MLILNITKESGRKEDKKTLIYGNKGDTVTFISDHDNVLIVENTRTKIRFSVKKSEVNNI